MLDEDARRIYELMRRILSIVAKGMELERLPQWAVSAEELGVGEALRANVLRMMVKGGLLEGRLIEGRDELAAINLQITLDGLEWLEGLREKLGKA